MKPHAAQLRQQQRKARLQESLSRAAVDPKVMMQYQQRQSYRRRDPRERIITQAEWEELVESHEDSGKSFRRLFFGILVVVALLLLYGKYDVEYNVEVPQIESGRGFSGETRQNGRGSDAGATTVKDLEEYFKTLGVEGRFTPLTPALEEDEAKLRRLENYRVKQQVRHAYEQHLKDQAALVYCGRSCESQRGMVQQAYSKLAAQVDRELFGVLLDAEDTMSARTTSMADLRKKYEEKKQHIEATEEDEEVRAMALEELRDALDILQDPDARKYYLLYGEKPPEAMRHVNARHGGWGQEIALGTFKYKLVWMWVDYLHQYIGLWGETFLLLVLVGGLLAKLPATIQQAMHVVDDLGWADDPEPVKED